MELSVDTVKINRFDKFSGFTHASSPRYFENDRGELEPYDFSGRDDLEKKENHISKFMKTFQPKIGAPYLLNQIHSDQVFVLKNKTQTQEQVSNIKADAIITHLPETPIGIFTADCVPILLYDSRLHVAAAIHAGREGTRQNIVNKTIMAMQREYGCVAADLVVGLGLGIGGCCYEVDADCLSSFENKIPFELPFVRPKENGKFLLDLFAVNAKEGMAAGVKPENIFQSGECTFCSPMNYYSYRREGQTGRILTFIMLRDK